MARYFNMQLSGSRRVFVFLFILACSFLSLVLINRDVFRVFTTTVGKASNVTAELRTSPATKSIATAELLVDTSGLDKIAGYSLIDTRFANGKLDFRKVASYPLENEWLTPMDREILADGPVKDLTAVARSHFSTIQLVSPPSGGKVVVGDKITVRVNVKDGTGRQVLKGGHRVKVWMVQTQGGRRIRSAAAHVTDLRNGSFVASLPVLWSGLTEVRAALVNPREFQGIILRLMNTMKLMKQSVAAFSFGKTEQVTLCSFIPVVPGFAEVCNLTDLNNGLPWYCGKPTKKGLQCGHWASSSQTQFPNEYPMSEIENEIMRRSTLEPDLQGLLNSSVFFEASEGKLPSPVLTSRICFPPSSRDSWIDQPPSGFWDKNVWRPLNGCRLPPFNANCYNDTEVFFLGDSNALRDATMKLVSATVISRLDYCNLTFTGIPGDQIVRLKRVQCSTTLLKMYRSVQRRLKCTAAPDPRRSYHPNLLHVPLHCSATSRRAKLSWYPHAYPFGAGTGKWNDARAKKAPSAVLDGLPGTAAAGKRKYVILIHLFAHYSLLHSYVYALHVRDTALAVSRLLARNPSVKVLVRGPHSVTGNRFQLCGDYHVERSFAILRHEFRGLKDRVLLLDVWDMTVANMNVDVHPVSEVVDYLAAMMDAHVCS